MSKSARPAQSSINQFLDFTSTAETPAAIEGFLSLLPRIETYTAIRQFVIFHQGDLVKTLSNRLSKLFGNFELINPSASVFQISIPIKAEAKYIKGAFAILPSNRSNLYRITTISHSSFWNRSVRKIGLKLYPYIMPIFFKQNEIRDVLLFFEQSLGSEYQVRIADATMKSKRKKLETDTERRWTEISIDDIFDEAIQRGFWFTSLKFLIKKRLRDSSRFRTVVSGRIYKYGEVHFDWYFNEITSYLIKPLESLAAERLSLFNNRGIRERNYKVGFPIEIEYKNDIFSDVLQVQRFGEIISKYPDASKAVFHANPYYHASVADFLDGSSFEIWVLSPGRVMIVPQAKSSTQAIERLISHIFSEFKEGIVGEYKGD